MSSTICREKYFNYGSYLRSRGYDKEICNLVSNIENGKIQVGSFTPNGTSGGTITGNLNITGTLETQGGSNATGAGVGTSTFVPSATFSNGIRVAGVSELNGMIFQDTNNDGSGNIFSVPPNSTHLFRTGTGASKTQVDISGDLYTSGDISFGSATSSLAFFGATGSTQTTSTDISAVHQVGGGLGIAINDTFTPSGSSNGYTVGQIVESLHRYGLLE